MSAVVTLCSGAPVPFDPPIIDRQLTLARSVDSLAGTVAKVVFDLYDHCALVVRFFEVDAKGDTHLVSANGDRLLASARGAVRARAVHSGRAQNASLAKPAGFRLVVAPLLEGDVVIGLMECVVPTEMVKPKAHRLDLVARGTAARLAALRRTHDAKRREDAAAGTSFALGLKLAGVLGRAGELSAGVRGIVDLLARELHTPVVAWRIDPASEIVWLSATAGLGSARRAKLEVAEMAAMVGGDRVRLVRWLRDRAVEVFGKSATIVDGGAIVLAAAGHNAELELCGRELGSLLEQLPEASVQPFGGSDVTSVVDVAQTRLNELTPREREILTLLAGGAGTAEISRRLVISDKTVKTHVQNILRKLDVASRLEAAAIAIRAGYVSVSASAS